MRVNNHIKGSMVSYFKQKLRVVQHNTGWLRQGLCPACGKDKKFGINISFDRTNCFSCGHHPKPIALIMELENLTAYNEVYKFLEAFDSAEYLETPKEFIKEDQGELPEGYRILSIGDSEMGRRARAYMKNRGFDIDELTLKGVGYCVSGKYFGRIIIPFYEAGKMVYFNARQFFEVSDDKFKNPSIAEFGIGKSLLIYNADCLHIYKRTCMMESAMNCLTYGENAFGIGGKIISQYQLSKVLRSPCKEVVVVLDSDAMLQSLQTGLTLSQHKRVKVVEMPEKADVNDIGKKETLKIIKSTPWQGYKDLFKRYMEVERPIIDSHES